MTAPSAPYDYKIDFVRRFLFSTWKKIVSRPVAQSFTLVVFALTPIFVTAGFSADWRSGVAFGTAIAAVALSIVLWSLQRATDIRSKTIRMIYAVSRFTMMFDQFASPGSGHYNDATCITRDRLDEEFLRVAEIISETDVSVGNDGFKSYLVNRLHAAALFHVTDDILKSGDVELIRELVIFANEAAEEVGFFVGDISFLTDEA
jgi:hypothetical protein